MYNNNEKLEIERIYDFVEKIVKNPLFLESMIAETEKYFLAQ